MKPYYTVFIKHVISHKEYDIRKFLNVIPYCVGIYNQDKPPPHLEGYLLKQNPRSRLGRRGWKNYFFFVSLGWNHCNSGDTLYAEYTAGTQRQIALLFKTGRRSWWTEANIVHSFANGKWTIECLVKVIGSIEI